MNTVIYETENGIFRFNQFNVIIRLTFYSSEHNVSEATGLLNSISSDNQIRIPEKNGYFRFICLDLVDQGKGTVTCKNKVIRRKPGVSIEDKRIILKEAFNFQKTMT